MVSLYDSHFALTGWPTGQFEHSEQICRSWFQYCPSVQIRAFAHDAKQDTSSTVMTDTITWKEQGKGYLQPKNETYRFLRISTIESCPFALDRSLMQRFAIDFFFIEFLFAYWYALFSKWRRSRSQVFLLSNNKICINIDLHFHFTSFAWSIYLVNIKYNRLH